MEKKVCFPYLKADDNCHITLINFMVKLLPLG